MALQLRRQLLCPKYYQVTPDLVANGDTFDQPIIYDGAWIIHISRPNGLAEGSIIVDQNKTVSFMYPNGEVDEITPY